LLYINELGEKEKDIAKQAVRTGQPIPDRILNAPSLWIGSELYLTAFLELDSERSHGMGLTRIPWTSIKEYALAFEFDEEQIESLLYIIPKLDSAHLKWLEDSKEKSDDT